MIDFWWYFVHYTGVFLFGALFGMLVLAWIDEWRKNEQDDEEFEEKVKKVKRIGRSG